jgi:hypothetical protein
LLEGQRSDGCVLSILLLWPRQEMMFLTLAPLVISALIFLACRVHLLWLGRKADHDARRDVYSSYFGAFLLVTYLALPAVSTKVQADMAQWVSVAVCVDSSFLRRWTETAVAEKGSVGGGGRRKL